MKWREWWREAGRQGINIRVEGVVRQDEVERVVREAGRQGINIRVEGVVRQDEVERMAENYGWEQKV